ncbi:MAG: ferrochelatase [Halieaceae bacterium]|jgi:protoporphyrin/coproporphyrin ferrochelatase|nr:ferrochelatase [Halieaceae bacterium]
MNYISNNFDHQQQSRIGVLITNLGTPDKPQKEQLRTYLRQFLSDPRVVEVPRLLWWLILNGIILNRRPKQSAAAYSRIWTEAGSPLLLHTQDQANALQESLSARFGDNVIVDFGMRYGQPSIGKKLQSLLDRGVGKLLVLPLYPQYAGPTTASTFDAVTADFTRRRWLPAFRFVSHYHDFPPYINALANKIRAHRVQHGAADKLVFSFHGEPLSYREQGDPYYGECLETAQLVTEQLGIKEQDYLVTFQSRVHGKEWLRPYTDETLKALPGQGILSVQILCPGFAADNLETLEEIGVENRDYFLSAGGVQYQYIPCLNSDVDHIDALTTLVTHHISGWSCEVS